MGVTGLWSLAEPVGRRISVQALANKRLAVDASIWIFQFMRAMRDERGEMLRNCHLLGFFRRICRLLFNKVRPIFVFDGATPSLKRATTAARRQRREVQAAKVRKTAEKLLMIQLKSQLLREEVARRAVVSGPKPVGKLAWAAAMGAAQAPPEQSADPPPLGDGALSESVAQAIRGQRRRKNGAARGEAASSAAAEGAARTSAASIKLPALRATSRGAAAAPAPQASDADGADQRLDGPAPAVDANEAPLGAGGESAGAPAGDGSAGEASAAALPDTAAHDGDEQGTGPHPRAKRSLNEMMAELEDDVDVSGADASALALVPLRRVRRRDDPTPRRQSHAVDADEEEEEEAVSDSDGEVDLDALVASGDAGSLDPAALSALPPSMQFEVINRLREQQVELNRARFQQVTGAPQDFSAVQMESYLKRTDFRRKVDEIRDSINRAAGFDESKPILGLEGRSYRLTENLPGGAKPDAAAESWRPSVKKRGGISDWNRRLLNGEVPAPRGGVDATAGAPAAAAAAEEGSMPPPPPRAPWEAAVPEVTALPSAQVLQAPTPTEVITLNLPLGRSESGNDPPAAPIMFGGDSEEEELADEFEWEEDAGGGGDGDGDAAGDSVPQADRALRRSEFWSLTHGFKFGRKLGDWDKERPDDGAVGSGASAAGLQEAEDALLQVAIQQSLDAARPGGGGAPGADATADAAAAPDWLSPAEAAAAEEGALEEAIRLSLLPGGGGGEVGDPGAGSSGRSRQEIDAAATARATDADGPRLRLVSFKAGTSGARRAPQRTAAAASAPAASVAAPELRAGGFAPPLPDLVDIGGRGASASGAAPSSAPAPEASASGVSAQPAAPRAMEPTAAPAGGGSTPLLRQQPARREDGAPVTQDASGSALDGARGAASAKMREAIANLHLLPDADDTPRAAPVPPAATSALIAGLNASSGALLARHLSPPERPTATPSGQPPAPIDGGAQTRESSFSTETRPPALVAQPARPPVPVAQPAQLPAQAPAQAPAQHWIVDVDKLGLQTEEWDEAAFRQLPRHLQDALLAVAAEAAARPATASPSAVAAPPMPSTPVPGAVIAEAITPEARAKAIEDAQALFAEFPDEFVDVASPSTAPAAAPVDAHPAHTSPAAAVDAGGAASRRDSGGELEAGSRGGAAGGSEIDEADVDMDALVAADDEVLAMLPENLQAAVHRHRARAAAAPLQQDAAVARQPSSPDVDAAASADRKPAASADEVDHGITVKAPPAAFDQAMATALAEGGGAAPGGATSAEEAFDLEASLRELVGEAKAAKRDHKVAVASTETPTHDMFRDVQELLQLFGLPYIIAPMEAEAQCAWLNAAGMVDGVVTDDNDVFLFGANLVYRHLFEDKQYVEEYRAADLETELGLSREKLVHLALLLGSDYTEGISGIGIVNAMETVHVYPRLDDLRAFREWVDSPDTTKFARIDARHKKSQAKKKRKGRAKRGAAVEEAEDEDDDASVASEAAAADQAALQQGAAGAVAAGAEDPPLLARYKAGHRNASKNWEMPAGFPSGAVVNAYLHPKVDESRAKFEWGAPDRGALQRLCRERFAWTADQVDALLSPVIEAYEARASQARLEAFYTVSQRFAKIRSKRLAAAVAGVVGAPLAPDLVLGLPDAAGDDGEHASGDEAAGAKRKRNGKASAPRQRRKKAAASKDPQDADETEAAPAASVDAAAKRKSAAKAPATRPRRKKAAASKDVTDAEGSEAAPAAAGDAAAKRRRGGQAAAARPRRGKAAASKGLKDVEKLGEAAVATASGDPGV